MDRPEICEAIRELRLIELRYDWGYRLVEPHAYGRNYKGDELLRCYQIGGESESGQPVGWKLFRVDDITSLHIRADRFAGPRPGYNPNDKALDARIYCEL